MDEKDEKILRILKENSKLTTHKISKKILMPITTIHNRIKKLEKEGIIKRYTIELDNKKIGKNIAAYIHIVVDYKLLKEIKMSQHELARKLKQNEFVEEAAMVTGGTDIIIKVRVKDIDELDDFVTKKLRNIDGIEKTQTMIVLNEI
ncbi:Lrp/AsnC family transcriptional regulator [Candidatus Woesearchaeota archaeon]|nr:Lrp/AsnC family transcriptional regulator [Candidatus Woesearchaeota archaeon]